MGNDVKVRLDQALSLDIDKLIKDSEQEINYNDSKEIERFNKRQLTLSQLHTDIESARQMPNKTWAEMYLKRSVEKIAIVQEIASQEIEDNPASKNVTSFGELSNAMVASVNAVLDIEREDQKLRMSQEKNDLRRLELESKGGPIINAENSKKIIGIGSNDDILRLIKNNIIDVE
jgi:hypothetical protein